MLSQASKKAGKRNHNKFRLSGIKANLIKLSKDEESLTKPERNLCKKASGEIALILKMWRSKI